MRSSVGQEAGKPEALGNMLKVELAELEDTCQTLVNLYTFETVSEISGRLLLTVELLTAGTELPGTKAAAC